MFCFLLLLLILLLLASTPSRGTGVAERHQSLAQRKSDPFLSANLEVQIDGIVDHDPSFELEGGAMSEMKIEDFKDGSELTIHRVSDLTNNHNLILKRRFRSDDLNLWLWYKRSVIGSNDHRSGFVLVTDKQESQPLRFFFEDAFPIRYQNFYSEGAACNRDSDNLTLVEEIEIAMGKVMLAFS